MGPTSNVVLSKHLTIDQLIVNYEKEFTQNMESNSLHETVSKVYALLILLAHTNKKFHQTNVQRFDVKVSEETNKKANEYSNGWGSYGKGGIRILAAVAKPFCGAAIEALVIGFDTHDRIKDNERQEKFTYVDYSKDANQTRRQENAGEDRNCEQLLQKLFNDMQQNGDKKAQFFNTILKG